MSELREPAQTWGKKRKVQKREEAIRRQAEYKALSLSDKFARAIMSRGNSSKELAKLRTRAYQLSPDAQNELRETVIAKLSDFVMAKDLAKILEF